MLAHTMPECNRKKEPLPLGRHSLLLTELEECAQSKFQPLCAVNILHEHLGRNP